ncbi:MAG TPA: DUF6647 family protein [Burkholderiales bacterium]|nr:DUF6647 family protein [Burkholderiales bacterium]
MDQSAILSLMVELFAAIRLVSAYPAPDSLPEIHALPMAQIQQRLCGGRQCRVKAYYHPDAGVIVDETLDFVHDDFDRSVLLHELVHHLQKTTGKFGVVTSFCSRRISEELEAYEIQNRYLSRIHATRRAFVTGWTGKCKEDDAAFATNASSGPAD